MFPIHPPIPHVHNLPVTVGGLCQHVELIQLGRGYDKTKTNKQKQPASMQHICWFYCLLLFHIRADRHALFLDVWCVYYGKCGNEKKKESWMCFITNFDLAAGKASCTAATH